MVEMKRRSPAKTLDRVVRPPARFEEEMDAPLLVLGIKVGVIGSARTSCVREDQNTFRSIHEALCFSDIGACASTFKPLLTVAP